MIYEIFVDDSLSSKSLLKKSNNILNKDKRRLQKKDTVFCKPGSNYVISVFGKRIRISLMDDSQNDIKDIECYLSNILNGRTVLVTNGSDFKKTFSTLNNINIVEV